MFQYVEMAPADGQLLFTQNDHHLPFLLRTSGLASRWEVSLVAFRLEPSRVRLLLHGEPRGLSHFVRLCQSGQGAWMHQTQGLSLRWAPAHRVNLPEDTGLLRSLVSGLHAGPQPLLQPWTSLWDALGLRHAPWFNPVSLQTLGYARGWLEDLDQAPLQLPPEGPQPMPWVSFDLAVAAAMLVRGELSPSRPVLALATRIAAQAGWTREALASCRGVLRDSVRRNLERPTPLTLIAATRALAQPELRRALCQGLLSGTIRVKGGPSKEPPWTDPLPCSSAPAA